MLQTGHFWSNPKFQIMLSFLLLFLYLEFFGNSSLALIQFNIKKHELYYIVNLGSLFQLEANTFSFSTLKNTYRKILKFLFTETELMLKVYVP